MKTRFLLGATILAAGRSSRMGTPKLLLPWGKTSILGHLINQWQNVGAQQIAVVRAGDDVAMDRELARLSFPRPCVVANPKPEQGMFSSVLCAARWTGWNSDLTHWAISLGDQPHLQQNTLKKLVAAAADHPGRVCQPKHDGRLRHPVVLPRALFAELAQTSASTLKEFLLTQEIAACECQDTGLSLDIDRPEDYQKALTMAGLIEQAS